MNASVSNVRYILTIEPTNNFWEADELTKEDDEELTEEDEEDSSDEDNMIISVRSYAISIRSSNHFQ